MARFELCNFYFVARVQATLPWEYTYELGAIEDYSLYMLFRKIKIKMCIYGKKLFDFTFNIRKKNIIIELLILFQLGPRLFLVRVLSLWPFIFIYIFFFFKASKLISTTKKKKNLIFSTHLYWGSLKNVDMFLNFMGCPNNISSYSFRF